MRIIVVVALVAVFSISAAMAQDQPGAAVRQYLECAKTGAQDLDDRISDASTVAIGLHAQCRTAFLDVGLNLERQGEMANLLRPTLVQIVLMNRSSKRTQKKQ